MLAQFGASPEQKAWCIIRAVLALHFTTQALMSGNHPVVASNHTVILNWNRETIPLLRQIAICQLERGSAAFQGWGSTAKHCA